MSSRVGWSAVVAMPVVAVAVSLVLASRSPMPEAGARALVAQGSSKVQPVYLQACATCHGARGEGTRVGPRIAGVGSAMVDYMLSTGRMPIAHPTDQLERHQPAYNARTRAALVAYIASFGPGGPAIPTVDLAHADLGQGSQLFQLNCAPCHSAAGIGGALLDQSAPPLRDATPVQTAEAVRSGPSPMPAFGRAALSDRQVDDVVAYVQYLRRPTDRGGFALGHLGPIPEGATAIVLGLGTLVVVTILIERRRRA